MRCLLFSCIHSLHFVSLAFSTILFDSVVLIWSDRYVQRCSLEKKSPKTYLPYTIHKYYGASAFLLNFLFLKSIFEYGFSFCFRIFNLIQIFNIIWQNNIGMTIKITIKKNSDLYENWSIFVSLSCIRSWTPNWTGCT